MQDPSLTLFTLLSSSSSIHHRHKHWIINVHINMTLWQGGPALCKDWQRFRWNSSWAGTGSQFVTIIVLHVIIVIIIVIVIIQLLPASHIWHNSETFEGNLDFLYSGESEAHSPMASPSTAEHSETGRQIYFHFISNNTRGEWSWGGENNPFYFKPSIVVVTWRFTDHVVEIFVSNKNFIAGILLVFPPDWRTAGIHSNIVDLELELVWRKKCSRFTMFRPLWMDCANKIS